MNYARYAHARKYGYRSGLEKKLADYLKSIKVTYDYESIKIEWEDLAYRTYTPDFILYNGIIIEAKGMFTAIDRRKHLCIKRQHPKLDIRFIFENSKRKIRKGSNTTYGMWCDLFGFKYHCVQSTKKYLPDNWLKEIKEKQNGKTKQKDPCCLDSRWERLQT